MGVSENYDIRFPESESLESERFFKYFWLQAHTNTHDLPVQKFMKKKTVP